MAHPLIPKIQAVADPLAASLELEVVQAVFQTNQSPPVLRLDVRHLHQDTSLEHCEQMSRSLEAALEEAGTIPDAYVLEVSSPGVSSILAADRDFVSFKGFPVAIQTTEPHKGHSRWEGSLVRRDDDFVHLTQKGRPLKIPRSLIAQVELVDLVE